MTKLSTITCSYFPTCSGCKKQTDLFNSPNWQQIQSYFSPHPITLHHDKVIGWRMRAKLAVRGTTQNPSIGLFKAGTHEVFDLIDCPLHHPSINQALQIIRETLSHISLEPYNETKISGLLRYLQFVVERKTGKVQLTLVINAKTLDPNLTRYVKQLYTHDIWHSIWVNFQPGSTNTILSDQWQRLEGEPYVWESLNNQEIPFHPACFAQAHLDLFELMLKHIEENLLPHKKVLELFAGVGAIGFTALPKSQSVTCVEANPFAKQCFDLAKQKLPEGSPIFFQNQRAENASIDQAEVLIVDPPRKGLDAQLRKRILGQPQLQQLIYVSCGWEGFVRDCDDFLKQGWQIQHAAGYLLIPGSDQIETLTIFKK